MTLDQEQTNRTMLRVRDTIDREFAEDLDLAVLARLAHLSPDHLVRTFAAVFGETPHRYLQRRRIERAMFLLRRSELSVTAVCLAVGFSSLGTFSALFSSVIGQSPSSYAAAEALPEGVPGCFTMAWTRPSSFTHDRSESPSISRKRPDWPSA